MTTSLTAPTTSAGDRMLELAGTLYPFCRSITGDGVRETLAEIGRRIPLDVHEVASGTRVLDWTVPDEWNIRDAYVADPDGRRIVDFQASNLHVVGYSEPVAARLTGDELHARLHVHPTEPGWIPYRTAYYERTWGFCVTGDVLEDLGDGPYDVVVDSTLEPGSLTYGECVLPGETDREIVLSTHVCHPSLANDNLSGIVVLTELAAALAAVPRRLSYRLLFVPGTIGSIAWLARNEDTVGSVVGGLVVACVGDGAPLTYKQSRRGNARVDRAASLVVGRGDGRVRDFVPWGWDERQFNSPGFDLGVGALTRSADAEFPEYHSSADDLSLLDGLQLEGAVAALLEILDVVENDRSYLNLHPKGEPQLGRRGLYRGMGGADPTTDQLATLWVLNQSDGTRSLLDVAERSGLAFSDLQRVAGRLAEAGLLEPGEWTT